MQMGHLRIKTVFAANLWLVLVVGLSLAEQPLESGAGDMGIAFGRFHPMVLHLPIGFFAALVIFELAARIRKVRNLVTATMVLLVLSCLSSSLSSLLGILLSYDGFAEEQVFLHKILGLSFTLLCWLCLGCKYAAEVKKKPSFRKPYMGMLCLNILVLGAAGHEGGSLTHGEHYLFEKWPAQIRRVFIGQKSAPVEPSGHLFATTIRPILEAHCTGCHGPEKQKGDLRLDIREHALKGGESGEPALVPHDAMRSKVVKLISYPNDHEEVMPPSKKKRMSAEEILIIIRWIDAGASW